MPRIAIEDDLQNVKQVLQDNGYEVISLEGNQMPECDCCVISGEDKNMMGMQDRQAEISIINAEGLSAEEVFQAVQERIQRQQ